MGFASPQIKHDENGYTRTSDPDRTLSVFELCEEFKTYFNWQWAQYKDKQASTACGDREIWKWLKRIIELDAEKESELARLRAELDAANALVKRYEAALDLIWSWAHICTFHVSRDIESGVVTFGIFNKEAQEFASRGCDTQLDAIEAAMKEKP